MVEHDGPIDVFDRHDRAGECPAGDRLFCAILGIRHVGVEFGSGESFDGCDQIGADIFRNEVDAMCVSRVLAPRAAVGQHRDPRHRLHAAGEDQILPAGSHLLCGDIDRLQP